MCKNTGKQESTVDMWFNQGERNEGRRVKSSIAGGTGWTGEGENKGGKGEGGGSLTLNRKLKQKEEESVFPYERPRVTKVPMFRIESKEGPSE